MEHIILPVLGSRISDGIPEELTRSHCIKINKLGQVVSGGQRQSAISTSRSGKPANKLNKANSDAYSETSIIYCRSRCIQYCVHNYAQSKANEG